MSLTGKSDVLLSPRVHNKEEWLILGDLPDDLLAEVLRRLPGEWLIMCKCVCKLWYRLITDVCVPKVFSLTPISGLFYRGYGSEIEYASAREELENQTLFEHNREFVNSFSAVMPFHPSNRDLLDCCNGLLLFVKQSVPWYCIFNPATKQVVEIPRDSTHHRSVFVALAFDPLESPHYKVVHFNHWPNFPQSDTVSINVFSSESGKWLCHPIPLDTTVKVATWIRRCVYLDGVLYLLSHSRHLLRFDLNELNAYATELPKKDETDIWGCIGVSRGCIYYSNRDGSTLFVWALEVEHKVCRWILKHTICVNDFIKDPCNQIWRPFGRTSWFKPYALDPNSEAVFIGVPRGVFRYNADNKTLELVYSLGPDEGILSGYCAVFTYTPCLVILKDCKQIPHMLWGNGYEKKHLLKSC